MQCDAVHEGIKCVTDFRKLLTYKEDTEFSGVRGKQLCNSCQKDYNERITPYMNGVEMLN